MDVGIEHKLMLFLPSRLLYVFGLNVAHSLAAVPS